MKAENINFTQSLSLAIPVFEYNENTRERIFKKMFIFPQSKLSGKIKHITNKLKVGYAFMNYGSILTEQDIKILSEEMEIMFGPEWEKRLGFSKTSKTDIIDDHEDRIIFIPNAGRIPPYGTWLNLLIELENKLHSKIEYIGLSDMETNAQLILDGHPIIGKDILISGRDKKYNLPLYTTKTHYGFSNLMEPILLTNSRIIRCDDYNKILTNFLFDEYQSESFDGISIYQQHISIILPLLYPDQNFISAFRQRNNPKSAFPSYYNHRINADEMLRIETIKKHINELYTFTNVKSVIFKYNLVDQLSKLYKNNTTIVENIFNSIETSELFPVSIISNKRGGTYTAKIFNEEKPAFNYMLDSGIITTPSFANSVAIYANISKFTNKFIVEISNESELTISIFNKSSISITRPIFDHIFSIISKYIISQIDKNKNNMYPLYVDKIIYPEYNIHNIIMFSTHISTPYNLTRNEFKKMSHVLIKSFSPVFDISISGDSIMLQDDFASSRITIKYGTTIAIHIRRLEIMDVYNLYINLILKAIASWYETIKTINKGTAVISNIKLLKTTDPARFDFTPKNPADKYSTRVQKTKQPTVMSIREIRSKKFKPYQYVTLDNLTFPNKQDTYVCKSTKFPYIGFVSGLKKKYNICSPGCFKVNQSSKKSTSIIYNDCVSRAETEEPGNNAEIKTKHKLIQSTFYIGKYDSQISTGKYYSLPWEFNKQLNINPLTIQSVIGKSDDIYAIIGWEPNGLISLINKLLDVDFIADVIKLFSSNPSSFLNITDKFGDRFIIPDNYIDFLKKEKTISEISYIFIEPMISLLYPDIGFFIILPKKNKHVIDFIGLGGISRQHIYNSIKETSPRLFTLILKNKIYSPVIHIKEKKNIYQLNSGDKLINLLCSFYDPDGDLKYNPQQISTRKKIYDIISSQTSKLSISIIEDSNISTTVRIENKTIVVYYKIPSSGVVLSDIKTVMKFLDAINLDIITAYRNKKNNLTYIIAEEKIIIPLKPVPAKKYSNKMEIVLYEPLIMKYVKPVFPRELIDIVYDRHLERLAFIALNTYVRKQKNTSIRNKILLVIKNKKSGELEKINGLSYNDIMLIRDLLKLNTPKFKYFFDKIQFDFDTHIIREELTSGNINAAVKKILNKLVVVRNKTITSPYLDNVICSGKQKAKSPMCYQNKLIVSTSGKRRIQTLFSLILSNNNYSQEVLFNSSIPLVNEYTLTPNETIKILTI